MPSAKKKQRPQESSPTFEQAMEELGEMVETMESGHLPLEKLITSYERGAELINHCEMVLNDARKRLELITLTPKTSTDGDAPNDLTNNEATTSNNDNDDEIRLF